MNTSIPGSIGIASLALIVLGLGAAPAQAANCKGFTTMTVKLVIVGDPKDGFRIVGSCGNVEVARCRAVIEKGEKRAKCQESGFVEGLSGRVRCTVGPKNGNSANAAEKASACLLK